MLLLQSTAELFACRRDSDRDESAIPFQLPFKLVLQSDSMSRISNVREECAELARRVKEANEAVCSVEGFWKREGEEGERFERGDMRPHARR